MEGNRVGKEEVQEVTYLGYRFKRNGRNAYKGESEKGDRDYGSGIWGIGKRRFRGNWKTKMELFDWMVGSVIRFGAEIWGWEEWEKVERDYKKDI